MDTLWDYSSLFQQSTVGICGGEGIYCRALGICEGSGPLGDIGGLWGQVSPGGTESLWGQGSLQGTEGRTLASYFSKVSWPWVHFGKTMGVETAPLWKDIPRWAQVTAWWISCGLLSPSPKVSWKACSALLVQNHSVPLCPAAAGVPGPPEHLCLCG